MKRGEHVVVGIETLTPKGDGLAVLDGREILVPRTVPGDRAEVYLRRKRIYQIGRASCRESV